MPLPDPDSVAPDPAVSRVAALRRLASSRHAELEQSLFRMMVVGTVLAGFLGYQIVGGVLDDGQRRGFVLAFALFALAVAIALHALATDRGRHARRLLGIALDVGGITYFMATAGAAGAAAFALFPFVAIGNGLRFGRRYRVATLALSLAGVAVAWTASDFWSRQPWAVGALVVVLLALPYYAGAVSGRVEAALRRAGAPRVPGPAA